jgi:putative sterol carrier protein
MKPRPMKQVLFCDWFDIIDYKFLNIDAYDAMGKLTSFQKLIAQYRNPWKMLAEEAEDNESQKTIDLKKYGEQTCLCIEVWSGKFRKSKPDTRKKYDPYKYANYTDVMDIIQDIKPLQIVKQ